jgi:hypothetical protein
MPPDVAAGGAERGDGDAGLDGDLVAVGFHGDLGGLAGVGQADLDLLPAENLASTWPAPLPTKTALE